MARPASASEAYSPTSGELTAFHPERPVVSSERILRIQGYSDFSKVRPVIRRTAEAMADVAMSASVPCVAYRRIPVRAIRSDELEVEGSATFHCRAFARTLENCTQVVPFVLTAGADIDDRVVALAEAGDLLEAVLLETAGWLCVEDATRQFKIRLRTEALNFGHRITSRLGPGYSYKIDGEMCMWPLEEQTTLFGLLGGGGNLPVSLMRSCAMRPKLSRSGMYGEAPLQAGAAKPDIHLRERIQ